MSKKETCRHLNVRHIEHESTQVTICRDCGDVIETYWLKAGQKGSYITLAEAEALYAKKRGGSSPAPTPTPEPAPTAKIIPMPQKEAAPAPPAPKKKAKAEAPTPSYIPDGYTWDAEHRRYVKA